MMTALTPVGLPVAHLVYGVPQTINCANYAYFLAMERVARLNNLDATRTFTGAPMRRSRDPDARLPSAPSPRLSGRWQRSCWSCTAAKGWISIGATQTSVRRRRSTAIWCRRVRTVHLSAALVRRATQAACQKPVGSFDWPSSSCRSSARTSSAYTAAAIAAPTLHRAAWPTRSVDDAVRRDFMPLLDTLGLFFQIRDDYANLLSDTVSAAPTSRRRWSSSTATDRQ